MRASHRTLSLVALLATAVAVPALAQTGSAPLTNYAACTTTPTKQDSEQAHSAFLIGKRFFDEADYGSAIHNFVDAYKLDCTKTELLTIVARAHELNGNRPEAVHALETYLQRAPSISADDKGQIQKRIDNLKAQIAAQQPTATVAPSSTATTPATGTSSASSTPTATSTAPPPPPEQHHTAYPWLVTAVGGAAIVGGVIVLIVGSGRVSSAKTNARSFGCNPDVNPPSCPPGIARENLANINDQLSSGYTLQTVGGVLMGAGGAAVIGGLVWHFVEPTGPAHQSDTRARLEPSVGPGYAGLSFGAKF